MPTYNVIVNISKFLLLLLQVDSSINNSENEQSCTILRRFEHPNKPQHGWVVHCRSVAPPRCLKRLNLVPFLQYGLTLDLELMQIVKKSEEDNLWPLHVDSLAYNSNRIFYTDKVRNSQGGGVILASIHAKKKVK